MASNSNNKGGDGKTNAKKDEKVVPVRSDVPTALLAPDDYVCWLKNDETKPSAAPVPSNAPTILMQIMQKEDPKLAEQAKKKRDGGKEPSPKPAQKDKKTSPASKKPTPGASPTGAPNDVSTSAVSTAATDTSAKDDTPAKNKDQEKGKNKEKEKKQKQKKDKGKGACPFCCSCCNCCCSIL